MTSTTVGATEYVVYLLTFPNGKKYVGITNNFERRMRQHKHSATTSIVTPLYAAIRKYGFDSITSTIVHRGSRSSAAHIEIATIRVMNLRDRQYGYNLTRGGDLSPTHTPEILAKLIITLNRPDVKIRRKAAQRAAFARPEVKAASAERMRRRWQDPVYREKMSAMSAINMARPEIQDGLRKGRAAKPMTEDQRATQSAAAIERMSDPGRRKQISDAVRKVWADPVYRERTSAAMRKPRKVRA